MRILYKKDERDVIPRLRNYELTTTTGELSLPSTGITKGETNYHISLFSKWKNNPNVHNAKKLYSSALVLGAEDRYEELAMFLLENDKSPNSIIDFIKKKININILDTFETENRLQIKNLKQKLRENPKNPILWMELSRNYYLENEIKKSEKCADTAISLDKNNRFIIRSSSRLFYHLGDLEKSLKTIRISEYHKVDPWLLSADLAYSNILKRKSKLIDHSIKVINDHKYDPSYITELSSSVGTYEYKHGSNKNANKYIAESLIKPTDNSLAQAIWLSDTNITTGLKIIEDLKNITLNYEAKTLSFLDSEKFQEAYDEALKWHNDEPYSIRPINIASYIDCIFLKNYNNSIQIIKLLLKRGFDHSLLINNLMYMLLKTGNISEANDINNRYFNKIIEKENDNSVYLATKGMLEFRLGNPKIGDDFYTRAIKIALKKKENHNMVMAIGNYLIESKISNHFNEETKIFKDLFLKTTKNMTEADVQEMVKDVNLIFIDSNVENII